MSTSYPLCAAYKAASDPTGPAPTTTTLTRDMVAMLCYAGAAWVCLCELPVPKRKEVARMAAAHDGACCWYKYGLLRVPATKLRARKAEGRKIVLGPERRRVLLGGRAGPVVQIACI